MSPKVQDISVVLQQSVFNASDWSQTYSQVAFFFFSVEALNC